MNSDSVVLLYVSQFALESRLSSLLSAAGLLPISCTSAEDLYRTLKTQRVEALLIEEQLPGFFRGSEIIGRMQQDLLRPLTLLIAQPTREIKAVAATLKIDAVIPLDESPEEICERIKTTLVKVSHTMVAIPGAARQLVMRSNELRPIPQLMVRLANYLGNDTASLNDIARDISTDPKVTSDLLRLTNSPTLGARTKILNVLDAVTYLGIRRTVAMSFSTAIRSSQASTLKPFPPAIQEWFQFRSVLIASGAGVFAGKMNPSLSESAYILGLMQELGILVMLSELGGRYQKLLGRVLSVGQLQFASLEMQEIGYTHADVSAALLQKWGLPNNMVRLVARHHDSRDDENMAGIEKDLLTALRIGDAFADFRDVPCPQRYERLAKSLVGLGTPDSDSCRAGFALTVKRTLESAEIFSVAVPSEAEFHDLLENTCDQVNFLESAETVSLSSGTMTGAAATAAIEIGQSHETKEGPCILAVDDDPAIRQLIAEHLELFGFQVATTDDFSVALREAERSAAVVCDVHLGTLNGVDLVRELRSRGIGIPVIMISGDMTRETVFNCIQAGVFDYLPKPFTRKMLIEKLIRCGVTVPGPRSSKAAIENVPVRGRVITLS